MMLILVSTEDHVAAGGLSYVGSEELDIATREWRRRMDTTHTLHCFSNRARFEIWSYLQSTDSKYPKQDLLLAPSQVQTPNDRHGKNDDCEVRYDIQSRIREPHGKLVDTSSRFVRPECSNRNTSEDVAKHCPRGVYAHNSNNGPASNLKWPRWEYTAILK